ncbi:MAG: class I SAM-dependent methyltransferase [Candidatus Acidiferrales bacterium]
MRETESLVSKDELQAATENYYREYSARKGADRNSLLHNPEVLFQSLARDAAMVRALGWIAADPQSARVLDVGCGAGDSLWILQRLGFEPLNLFGVDIQEDKIVEAKARNPLVHFDCANATRLAFPDDAFDIAMESMMFLQLTDDEIAGQIAAEMIRVTKPGGVMLVSDWRYSRPGSSEFQGVTPRRIAALYQTGGRTEVCRTFRGSLVPPVGRFLSRYASSAYFAVQALFPFLAGHQITILKKKRLS